MLIVPGPYAGAHNTMETLPMKTYARAANALFGALLLAAAAQTVELKALSGNGSRPATR